MATPNFNTFEDATTFDVIWQRITDDDLQTGPGEPLPITLA